MSTDLSDLFNHPHNMLHALIQPLANTQLKITNINIKGRLTVFQVFRKHPVLMSSEISNKQLSSKTELFFSYHISIIYSLPNKYTNKLRTPLM